MLRKSGFRWLSTVTCLAALALIGFLPSGAEAQVQNRWQGGNGNFSDSNWYNKTSYSQPWTDGTSAVFDNLGGGTAGTVTVDNAGHYWSLTGMGFNEDGWTIANGGGYLDFGSCTYTVKVPPGWTETINAVIAENGHSSVLNVGVAGNTGTLVLGGANTYTGVTTISYGTLRLANSLALQNSTLDYSAGTLSFGTLTGATLGGLQGSQSLTLPSSFTLSVGNNGNSTEYYGALSGSNVTLRKVGAGTLSFRGTSPNTYSGVLEINQGDVYLRKDDGVISVTGDIHLNTGVSTAGGGNTLCPVTSGQIASTSTMTFNPGTGQYAIFNMHGYDQTVAGISDATGRGVIQNGYSDGSGYGNTATLTVNNTTDCSYNGIIQNYYTGGADSSVALVKAGSATLTLGDSTYDNIGFKGGLTVNGGTLKMGSAHALGSTAASNTLTVNSSGAIDVNGQSPAAYTNAVTINGTGAGSNGALLNSSATAGGNSNLLVNLGSDSAIGVTGAGSLTVATVLGSHALTKVGTGRLILNGGAYNDDFTDLTVAAGTFQIDRAGCPTSSWGSGNVLIQSGGTIDTYGAQSSVAKTATINGTGVGGNGALINTSAGYDAILPNVQVTLGSDSTIGVTNVGSLTLGAISGNHALTTIGSGAGGVVVLDGADTYTGATTVSAGTLLLDNNSSALMHINPTGAPTEQFLGTGTLMLDGTLKLDLSAITGTSGSWMLVDMAHLAATYNVGTFAVTLADGTPFANSGGVWTYAAGGKDWSFSQSTGMLTLGVVPEPGTLILLATCLLGLLVYTWRGRK